MMTLKQRAKFAWLAAKQQATLLEGLWELTDADIEQALGPKVSRGAFDQELQDVVPDGISGDREPDISGLVEAILTVGRERKELLDRLRLALVANKPDHALSLARQLCNVQKGEDAHDNRSTKAVH
jgi:hypothetical protein